MTTTRRRGHAHTSRRYKWYNSAVTRSNEVNKKPLYQEYFIRRSSCSVVDNTTRMRNLQLVLYPEKTTAI